MWQFLFIIIPQRQNGNYLSEQQRVKTVQSVQKLDVWLVKNGKPLSSECYMELLMHLEAEVEVESGFKWKEVNGFSTRQCTVSQQDPFSADSIPGCFYLLAILRNVCTEKMCLWLKDDYLLIEAYLEVLDKSFYNECSPRIFLSLWKDAM